MRPTALGAIEAQASALDAFVIDGIRHNIPFLSALMQHPRWREGRLSTGFIAEEFPDGFHPLDAGGRDRAAPGRGRGADRSYAQPAKAADFRASARARADALRAQARGRAGQEPASNSRSSRDAPASRSCSRTVARSRFTRTGARASRCGAAPSTATRWRCRCARSSTAMRSPMPESLSMRASTRAARRSSRR